MSTAPAPGDWRVVLHEKGLSSPVGDMLSDGGERWCAAL